MSIELTNEQARKVSQFRRHQQFLGVPKSLVEMRTENFRRTLVLDEQSYRLKASPNRRRMAVQDGRCPKTITPNAKASKRLDARVRAFKSMSPLDQASETMPGSLKP